MVARMSEVIAPVIEFFRQYNLVLLWISLILQGIGFPVSVTALVIASGAFASAGQYNIFQLFIEIWILESIGDCTGYWIWRIFGKVTLDTFTWMQKYFNPKLQKTAVIFNKHGKFAILFTRFPFSALGALVNATAGITKYKFLHFTLIILFGEFFWVSIYLGIGYWFSDAWEVISALINQFSQLFGLIIFLIAVVYISNRILIKKKSS